MSKSKRRSPPTVNPAEVFCEAQSYAHSGELLFKHFQSTSDRTYLFPSIVMGALSLELFIKSLLYQRGKACGQEHSIKKLFERLDSSERARIKEIFDLYVILSPAPWVWQNVPALRGMKLDLESTLMRCDRLFTKMRYQYENPDWGKDKEGFSGTEGMKSLMNALFAFIVERHPDWLEAYENNRIVDPPSIVKVCRP